MKGLVVLVCLSLVISSTAAFFSYPCPIGCTDTQCFNISACPIGCADTQCFSTGCIKCQRGYCRSYTRRMGVCVPSSQCGDGKYCYSSPQGSFCTACKDRNCKKCSGATNCTECKYRYELRNGECERKTFG